MPLNCDIESDNETNMKLERCETCLSLFPHLRVLLEDDVDLGELILDMQEGLSKDDKSCSQSPLLEHSCIKHKREHCDGMSSDDSDICELTNIEKSSTLPKSISLPLRTAVIDPFPELSHSSQANSPTTETTILSSHHRASSRSPPCPANTPPRTSTPPLTSPLLEDEIQHKFTTSPQRPPSLSYFGIKSEVSKSSPSSPIVRRSLPSSSRRSRRRDYPEYSDHDVMQEKWRGQGVELPVSKTMLNFYTDEKSHKTVSVEETMKASDVGYLLVLKNQAKEDYSWTVVEHVSKFQLERSLEDHESVLHVFRSWGHTEDNRFLFRKDYMKYEFFTNPAHFFPNHMLGKISTQSKEDIVDKSDRQKNLLLQNFFTSSGSLPDIHGYLHMKEGKKSWKKHYFVLRKSGLYYSTKGSSKEPRHLVMVSGVTEDNIYSASQGKKTLGAPNNHCFVLKPSYCVNDVREMKCFCAEDEQSRSCWMTALRIIKYGPQLYDNYKDALRRGAKLQSMENQSEYSRQSTPDGTSRGFNIYAKSRVAMDFTKGKGGRVVQDPNEALGVAVEEGLSWRKKIAKRISLKPVLSSSAPSGVTVPESNPVSRIPQMAVNIHLTQPWYHGNISRNDAVELIAEQGLVDGVFLIRESSSIPGSFVLSLAHNYKVKHCQISQHCSKGNYFVSLDGGQTKFSDLLQLVEFYQLNAAGLPTRLTHYVTRVS